MQTPHAILDSSAGSESLEASRARHAMLPLDQLAALVQQATLMEAEANRLASQIDVPALVSGDEQAERTLMKLMRLFWEEAVPLNQRATDLGRICINEAKGIRQTDVIEAAKDAETDMADTEVLLARRIRIAASTLEANIDQRLANIWERVLVTEAKVGEELAVRGKVSGLN